jgi:hypothetical protein
MPKVDFQYSLCPPVPNVRSGGVKIDKWSPPIAFHKTAEVIYTAFITLVCLTIHNENPGYIFACVENSQE